MTSTPLDPDHFARALRRVPGIVAGSRDRLGASYRGFGTLADSPDPAELCWEIGSITKVFTGILLAEMSLRGEVALDDPIGRHLPAEVVARLPAEQPTLHQLATHTSGLPRLPRGWLLRLRSNPDPYAAITERDVWDALGPRTARPRRPRFRYSNLGMGLLGHILALVAGTDYGTLLRTRLLDPLGLRATTIGGGNPVPGFRGSKPTPPWTFGALSGAGAVRSTAADLLAFAAAVASPPAGTLGEAMDLATAVAHRGRVIRVGLGWQHRLTPPGGEAPRIVWHNGGTYATAAFLAIDLDTEVAAVVFGNRGPRMGSPVDSAGWALFDRLRDSTP